MSDAFDQAFPDEPDNMMRSLPDDPPDGMHDDMQNDTMEFQGEETGVAAKLPGDSNFDEPDGHAALEPPSSNNDRMIPLARLNQEIEKRAQAEARLRELETPDSTAGTPHRPTADDGTGARGDFEAHNGKSIVDMKTNMSFGLIRQNREDFDEVIVAGLPELVSRDPDIMQRAYGQASPMGFLYEEAKRHLALKDMGDPAEFGNTKFQEGYEAARREMAGLQNRAQIEGLPESLAGERSVSGRLMDANPAATAFDRAFPD